MKGEFEKFSISYDADSDDLTGHKISAKDLGAAISAMSDLVNEAAQVLHSGHAGIELMVTTPAKKGSVVVEFLALAKSSGALEVLKYLGFSAVGGAAAFPSIINTVKKLKNRKITKITIEKNSDEAIIETENGSITVDKTIAQMVGNKKIREALHNVIQAPLHDKPNAEFKVLNSKEEKISVISERDIDVFSPLPTGSLEDITIDNEHLNISFSQVNFDSNRGWKILLPDGTEKSAIMRDEHFLTKVKANQQGFKKEDLYEARIRITTTSRPTRSTIIYEITEITRHWVKENRLV